MGLHFFLKLPEAAWREIIDWFLANQRAAVPIRVLARGELDLSRDTAKHRVYAARYEDLLK